MTRDFDPSVESVEWSRADGKVYFTAENRDMKSLYRMDPKSGRIAMIALPEEMIGSFSVPAKGAMAAFTGHGAQNPDRLYRLDLRKDAASLLDEPMAERLADVELGEFHLEFRELARRQHSWPLLSAPVVRSVAQIPDDRQLLRRLLAYGTRFREPLSP